MNIFVSQFLLKTIVVDLFNLSKIFIDKRQSNLLEYPNYNQKSINKSKMKKTVFHTSKAYLTDAFSQPDHLFPFLGSNIVDNYSKSIIRFKKVYATCNMRNINEVAPLPPPTKEFIFFGRSNVGKSSLMNKIMQSDVAAVSKRPGKTKQLLFCEVGSQNLADQKMVNAKIYFVDAPGYGFATGVSKSQIKQWGKLISLYLKRTKQNSLDQKILCLLDITHDLKQTDCLVFQLLKSMDKQFQIIFTKCDKFQSKLSKQDKQDNQIKKALDIVSMIQEKYQSANFYTHFTSSKTGMGINQLRNHILFSTISNQL